MSAKQTLAATAAIFALCLAPATGAYADVAVFHPRSGDDYETEQNINLDEPRTTNTTDDSTENEAPPEPGKDKEQYETGKAKKEADIVPVATVAVTSTVAVAAAACVTALLFRKKKTR